MESSLLVDRSAETNVCGICGKILKSKRGLEDHTKDKHEKKRNRKRKIISSHLTNSLSVSEVNGQVVNNLVVERDQYLNSGSESKIEKQTEGRKKQKLASLLRLLKEKSNDPPIRIVVDVDNIASIQGILDFFRDYAVYLTFFVKNQLRLRLPSFDEYANQFELALVESDDDDDLSALTEALNSDSFILTCDKYRIYLESGLVGDDWLDSHRVSCTWRKSKNSEDQLVQKIVPSIPLHILPKRK